jgi:uncharacterized protein
MELPEVPQIRPLPPPPAPSSYTVSFGRDLLLLAGIVVVAFAFSNVVGMAFLSFFYGKELADEGILHILQHAETLNGLRWYQMISTIGVFLVPALFYARMVDKDVAGYLGARQLPPVRDAWMLPGMVLSFFPILALMYFFNQQLNLPGFLAGANDWIRNLEEQSELFIKAMLQTTDTATLVMNIMLIAVLPAVCEELFFRGAVMKVVYGMTRDIHKAILISAVIFSFFHFQFLGFLPRLGLGILFGYLYWWSGSIWTPILAHLINNGWQVFAAYMYYKGDSPINIEEMELLPMSTTGLSMLFFLLLCYLYYKASCLSLMPPEKDA